MSEAESEVGAIVWMDLTVPAAEQVRDFYSRVVGWESVALEMDGYSDFCMQTPGSKTTVAGVCHAKGVNAELPAQWLLYVLVEDLDRSRQACVEHGGKLLTDIRTQGEAGRYCVIEDPAGAVMALYQRLKTA